VFRHQYLDLLFLIVVAEMVHIKQEILEEQLQIQAVVLMEDQRQVLEVQELQIEVVVGQAEQCYHLNQNLVAQVVLGL
jgi:hypothetical protein